MRDCQLWEVVECGQLHPRTSLRFVWGSDSLGQGRAETLTLDPSPIAMGEGRRYA